MKNLTDIGHPTEPDRKTPNTASMKRSVRKSTRKTLLIFVLICCSVTLSGCVYLRILALRKQFTQFDKYIVVDKKDGLTFSFLRPILYGKDIKWLGLYPVSQETESGVTVWGHVLEKVYNDNQSETGDYNIVLDTRYQNEKLQAIYFPESFFRSISKDFVIALCKYMGQSDMELDQRNREVRYTGGDVDLKHTLSSVKQDALVQQFGTPYLVENKNGIDSLEYHYRVKENSASTDTPERTTIEYVFKFTFSEQDSLIGVAVKFPFIGYIELDFDESEL